MTKTFNFYTKNTSTNTTYFPNKSTNYSKILDDIIFSDIVKKNDYLFTCEKSPIILESSPLKDSDEFTKATLFLANYKKYKKAYKLPFILGKMYTLANGTPIVFYDDEIQIGFDVYKYTDFSNLSILNAIKPKTKNIIIDIYTTGISNIEINIL